MVGQRFVQLLANHPWFEVKVVAASPQSAGRTYRDAVEGRWSMSTEVPGAIGSLTVKSVVDDLTKISTEVDVVFCALAMEKDDIKHIEEAYAAAGVAVISNNSAHRWTSDVPIIMPELNPNHSSLIEIQRRNRGWTSGLIVVKPNCSIQSYTSILTALKDFEPTEVHVTSLQAISGAGKTFETWPEMIDNVIPLIGGEEEKSEREPMKIWGRLDNDELKLAESPRISATCIRVPVTDGHLASVGVTFAQKPRFEQIVTAVQNYNNPLTELELPSAPKQLMRYFDEPDRPQTKLDRDYENGMGITMGRLRPGKQFDWEFIALAHNTLRGAAGGAVLTAELLAKQGYIQHRA
jgi:aspartate-semialdehyde dehydrogenase